MCSSSSSVSSIPSSAAPHGRRPKKGNRQLKNSGLSVSTPSATATTDEVVQPPQRPAPLRPGPAANSQSSTVVSSSSSASSSSSSSFVLSTPQSVLSNSSSQSNYNNTPSSSSWGFFSSIAQRLAPGPWGRLVPQRQGTKEVELSHDPMILRIRGIPLCEVQRCRQSVPCVFVLVEDNVARILVDSVLLHCGEKKDFVDGGSLQIGMDDSKCFIWRLAIS